MDDVAALVNRCRKDLALEALVGNDEIPSGRHGPLDLNSEGPKMRCIGRILFRVMPGVLLALTSASHLLGFEEGDPVVVSGPVDLHARGGTVVGTVRGGAIVVVLDVVEGADGARLQVTTSRGQIGWLHSNHVEPAIIAGATRGERLRAAVHLANEATGIIQPDESASYQQSKSEFVALLGWVEGGELTMKEQLGKRENEGGRSVYQMEPFFARAVIEFAEREFYREDERIPGYRDMLPALAWAGGVTIEDLLDAKEELPESDGDSRSHFWPEGNIIGHLCLDNDWFATVFVVIALRMVRERIPNDLEEMATYAAVFWNSNFRSWESYENARAKLRERETARRAANPGLTPEQLQSEIVQQLNDEIEQLETERHQTDDKEVKKEIQDRINLRLGMKAVYRVRKYEPETLARLRRREGGKALDDLLRDLREERRAPQRTDNADSRGESRDPSHPTIAREAGPPPVIMLMPAVMSAVQLDRAQPINLDHVFPSLGPPATTATAHFTVDQALVEGNAEEARAVSFRSDPDDEATTAAAVLVTKTRDKTYKHDYHVCARFHGYHLEDLWSVPIACGIPEDPPPRPSWFWFCRIGHERGGSAEVACVFAVFVDESRRKLTVDSRWIDKRYATYWRSAVDGDFDYALNFQVWSYSTGETLKLVRSILASLSQLPDSWTVKFANRQPPTSPTVSVEAATLADDVVLVSVWNRRWCSRMGVFHGTARSSRLGRDVFFEYSASIRPGRNRLRLPRGELKWRDASNEDVPSPSSIQNAVVHCEVNGFIDRVYVSADNPRSAPLPFVPASVSEPEDERSGIAPAVKIAWPADNAQVVVLRDQLDMPGDWRLAINGTYEGAPRGSTTYVHVRTDDWNRPVKATMVDGVWGARVHLGGKVEDGNNNHRISVRLRNPHGVTLAEDAVDGIVRFEPGEKRDVAFKPIVVAANKFRRVAGTVHFANDGSAIVGWTGSRVGEDGGAVACQVNLPADASTLKLHLTIRHGHQQGKSVHSPVQRRKVTVYLNEVPVSSIVCQYENSKVPGDYCPEPVPKFNRELPVVDLKEKGIRGRSLSIKIVADRRTCMDLENVVVQLLARRVGE